MIRYTLVCAHDHGFEAWFKDSAGFDEQSQAQLVECPRCGTSDVRKALMAPAVRTAKSRSIATATEMDTAVAAPVPSVPDAAGASPAMPIGDEAARRLRGLVRELHAKIRAEAHDVGSGFPVEARRIHEGKTAPRPIFGTASGEEARALVEDGIDIMPLPRMPDERN